MQVSGVWNRYQLQKADGVADIDVRSKRHGRSGRKGIDAAKMNEAGLGSVFDSAMLKFAVLAACEKVLDQSMPLMFGQSVSGELLASTS